MSDSDNDEPTIIAEDTGDIWANDNLMLPTSAQPKEEKPKDDEADTDSEVVEEEEADEPEPTQVEYVADPGEYVPNDYSFEVTTYDEEGNKPKNHKISTVDEWEALLEQEANFGSAAALMKAQRLATKMESNSERDRADYDKRKADFDAVKQEDDQRAETLKTWMSEMDYLVQRGDLPKITKEQADADWSKPDVAKQDGVKEQVALIKFMQKENTARTKAGLKPMTSIIDAFNAMNRTGTTSQPTTSVKKAEGDARKAAGARVASGSANPPVGNAPKGIAVGRGGSLDDLGNGWFH